MPLRSRTLSVVEEEQWEESARKRLRSSDGEAENSTSSNIRFLQEDYRAERKPTNQHDAHMNGPAKDKSITIASTAKMASHAVAPFLAKHIPSQYNPVGRGGTHDENTDWSGDPNTKYCYRHRPDMLCRRQADEETMDQLQKGLESLSQADRQGIVQVWSLFSAAPAKHRQLMLQGILSQCCFPQLSYLSTNIRELIRIDFLGALPDEIAYRILCFLDTNSLCKAAQVSRRWRQLADDDEVWHRMCEQHIDRKCTKCGVGLPLLERNRLRSNARQVELRGSGLANTAPAPPSSSIQVLDRRDDGHSQSDYESHHELSDIERSSDGRLSPVLYRNPASEPNLCGQQRKTKPWKDVYRDRFRVGKNWKHGRYSTKILKGHSNGVMALQILDNKWMATGSYDTTIKIWNLETGEEIRTLLGHATGVRCLQFDESKLISGSLDGIVKIWNWKKGECISTHQGHRAGVISLHFDSEYLVSGSVDNTACVWNFKDRSIFSLRGHTDWVNSVKIDSCSRTIFTASDDCTIRLWDLDTKQCLKIYEGHVGQVQQVLPCPSEFDVGDYELHEDSATNITHFAVQNVTPPMASVCRQENDESKIDEMFANQPDRPQPPRYMLSSALDSTIRLWDVKTGRCLRTFFGHLEGVWALAADNMRIISGSEDRVVKAWDPRTGKCERTFTGHAGPVTCLDLSDSRICSGGEDGEVRIYNFTT